LALNLSTFALVCTSQSGTIFCRLYRLLQVTQL